VNGDTVWGDRMCPCALTRTEKAKRLEKGANASSEHKKVLALDCRGRQLW